MSERKRKYEICEPIKAADAMKGFSRFYKKVRSEFAPAVDEEDGWIGPWWLAHTFEDVGDLATFIKKMQLILRNAKALGYERVDLSIDCGGYEGDELDVHLLGWRPETSAEARKRRATAKARSEAAKKAAKRRKAQKEVKDRVEYERLKRKFGK